MTSWALTILLNRLAHRSTRSGQPTDSPVENGVAVGAPGTATLRASGTANTADTVSAIPIRTLS